MDVDLRSMDVVIWVAKLPHNALATECQQLYQIAGSHKVRACLKATDKACCQVCDLICPTSNSAKKGKVNTTSGRDPGDRENKPSETQESPTATTNHRKPKLSVMQVLILLSFISMGI